MSVNNPDRQQTARPLLLRALLVCGAACVAASPSHAAVTATWTDGVSRDQTFSRVLVVGISPDVDVRCPFERAMAAKIKSANTVALVSCDVMPLNAQLTRENVEAAVAEQKADAVLVTGLISKEWEVQEGGTRDTRGAAYYKPIDSYYGVYGTVVAADFHVATPITTIQGEVHVVSKVYETRGATVVYTLDTEEKNIESRAEGVAAITAPIAKKLRRDGLIR
jgi:hypothetical protein